MIPVLSAEQTRQADAHTIKNEPIASIDLMERASKAFVKKFTELAERGHRIYVFSGIGNNGGDGLAIARMLKDQGYEVRAFTVGKQEKGSPDFTTNLERLSKIMSVGQILSPEHIPQIESDAVVIDALFGSGLSRPIEGIFADVVNQINTSGGHIFSVDIASGLYADQAPEGDVIIRPAHTITFQCPKAAFFHPSIRTFVGSWHVVDIGLDRQFISSMEAGHFFSEAKDFPSLFPSRSLFDHKGDAGRVRIIAGSKGKMGAAVLSARAALRTGAGLVFVHVPACGRDILQISVPEAMVEEDIHQEVISQVSPGDHDATAIGPGLDTQPETVDAMAALLSNSSGPLVIDADGLNILSANKELLEKVPKHSILTPHPGEFRRLVGLWKDDFEKIELLVSFSRKYQLNIVLKGAYSVVCSAEGVCFYNCSGNPGMATGGSGDVLTGVIVSLLGQLKDPFTALRAGVYLHGLAGNLAAEKVGFNGMIASDITDHLPMALNKILF